MRNRPPHIDLSALQAGIPPGLYSPVVGMARPSRPESERQAVRALAKSNASRRREAARISRMAVTAFLEHEKIEDELELALAEARQAFDPDPYLAVAFESDLHQVFLKHRCERYLLREGKQLSTLDWQAEGRVIASLVRQQLVRRYRSFLK